MSRALASPATPLHAAAALQVPPDVPAILVQLQPTWQACVVLFPTASGHLSDMRHTLIFGLRFHLDRCLSPSPVAAGAWRTQQPRRSCWSCCSTWRPSWPAWARALRCSRRVLACQLSSTSCRRTPVTCSMRHQLSTSTSPGPGRPSYSRSWTAQVRGGCGLGAAQHAAWSRGVMCCPISLLGRRRQLWVLRLLLLLILRP